MISEVPSSIRYGRQLFDGVSDWATDWVGHLVGNSAGHLVVDLVGHLVGFADDMVIHIR